MTVLQYILSWAPFVLMGLLFVGHFCAKAALNRLFGRMLHGGLSDGVLLDEMKEANRKHFLRHRRRLEWLTRRKEELPAELSPKARQIILAVYLNWGLTALMPISIWTALLIQKGYI